MYYNAFRQNELTSPCGQRTNPRTVFQHNPGILLFPKTVHMRFIVRSESCMELFRQRKKTPMPNDTP